MKILLVEDEELIRSAESAYLKSSGYIVIEAVNGKEALECFSQESLDLIILDINLPHINGIQVSKKIREVSTVPIIIVTARNQDEDELIGFDAGADDYIRKPFNMDIFMKRVTHLLQKNTQRSIKISNLSIDPSRMEVLKEGIQLNFTKIQFNLLYTLASKPTFIFTRDLLLDKMYLTHTPDVFPRTIDAHIKAIRKILQDDPANPRYIETVMGSGYRFITTAHV